jgi:hypothetical protein
MAPRISSWTKESDDILYSFCKSRLQPGKNGLPSVCKQDWDECGKLFPKRSVHACKSRFGELKALAEGKIPYRKRNRIEREKPGEFVTRMQNPARLPLPSSITAFICGDPLPGRSALDKKLSEGRHA